MLYKPRKHNWGSIARQNRITGGGASRALRGPSPWGAVQTWARPRTLKGSALHGALALRFPRAADSLGCVRCAQSEPPAWLSLSLSRLCRIITTQSEGGWGRRRVSRPRSRCPLLACLTLKPWPPLGCLLCWPSISLMATVIAPGPPRRPRMLPAGDLPSPTSCKSLSSPRLVPQGPGGCAPVGPSIR